MVQGVVVQITIAASRSSPLCSAGRSTGVTTTEGIYITGQSVAQGDCAGFHSARLLLASPSVDFAVLETARGGILKRGLAFDRCEVAVVLNVSADHLGLDGIETVDDLARVKSVVVESIRKDGWAILNAEDEHCRKIARNLNCNVAWFSMDEDNPFVRQLSKDGETVAVYENGFITVKKGEWKIRIEKAANVPLTLGGRVRFMIANVLAATLAAYLHGFRIEDISLSLQTFVPSPAQTPGPHSSRH